MNIGIDFDKFQKQEVAQVMTNYTKMPNSIIDDRIMARISDKAFKCLMFVMRQTMGFNRASHTIAITQFQKYCGIKKRDTVMTAIRELEQCKLITVERKTGCLNEYFLTLNQYHETGLVPLEGSTVKGDGTSTFERDGTSTVKRDTIKETLKENIKEIHTLENSPKNSVDDAWKPNLDLLTSILRTTKYSQRVSEILGMVDFEFHLGNFNAHWEDKITLTENQKTRKFVAWLIQEFERAQKSIKAKSSTPNRNVNDAWGVEQHYAPAGDIDCEGMI